jgi:hypothetical protein
MRILTVTSCSSLSCFSWLARAPPLSPPPPPPSAQSLGEHVGELRLVSLRIVILRVQGTQGLAELPVGHHRRQRLLEEALEMAMGVGLSLAQGPANGLIFGEVEGLDVDVHIVSPSGWAADVTTIETSVQGRDIHRHAGPPFCGALLHARQTLQDDIEGSLAELKPHLCIIRKTEKRRGGLPVHELRKRHLRTRRIAPCTPRPRHSCRSECRPTHAAPLSSSSAPSRIALT